MKDLVPTTPVVPDFTPVPRKYRYDGWTPERQKAFIEALAETGSVKAAARRVNMSAEGAYYLRRQPHADEFREAWRAALDHGVTRLEDIAMERAIDGVTWPVFGANGQIGERTVYNDRLLMFMLRHRLPDRFGALKPLPPGTKAPETIAREEAEAEEAEANSPEAQAAWLAAILKRYAAKVRAERTHRLSGQIAAADYTLRQLTHLELILDVGGMGQRLIDLWTGPYDEDGKRRDEPWISPLSEHLDNMRRVIWRELADPPRPPIDHSRRVAPHAAVWGGPNVQDRHRARAETEARMARDQRLWEAAGTEDSWAAWVQGEGEYDPI